MKGELIPRWRGRKGVEKYRNKGMLSLHSYPPDEMFIIEFHRARLCLPPVKYYVDFTG